MTSSTETILYVFGLVGLGYLCALSGLLKVQTGDALADFAIGVAVPMLLFRTMAQAHFEAIAPWPLWVAYFGAVIVAWAIGQAMVRLGFRRDAKAGVVGGVSAAFSNLVLLGIPVILSLYGQDGFEVLSLIVAVHLPIMMSASIILFELANRREGGLDAGRMVTEFASKLFSNPLIVGILAGLAFRLTGLTMPFPAMRIIESLGNVAGPVALFAMGMSLRKFGLAGNIAPGMALACIKLMIMPAAALGMALLLDLPPLVAHVAVMAAAMPAGVNSYLIAMRFGVGQGLATNAMVLGTAAALVSSAFWLWVLTVTFGS